MSQLSKEGDQLPKLIECQQGTAKWLEARAGIPTASSFDKIITPSGEPSRSAEKYMYTLLAERILGRPTIEHVSMWMQRGSEIEEEAVAYYELQRDCETVPVGFITNDAVTIGASPDRLCGEEGLLEVKSPKESIHMMYLLGTGGAYKEYKVQAQGQLWITGREWVDVLSYFPGLPYALDRIYRDDQFILKIEACVTAFSRELERKTQELILKGYNIQLRKHSVEGVATF